MEAALVTVRLKYLVEDVDRHGNVRLYVKRPRQPKVRIRAVPGTPEFMAAYEAAMARPKARPMPPAATLRGVCARYYASPVFGRLDAGTRKWRRRELDAICRREGDKPIGLMEPRHIRRLRDRPETTPAMANTRLKALKALFAWAIEEDLVGRNPAREVKPLSYASKGHHTWTVEEVQQYERRHPLGTLARLALALLLYTGGRREDGPRFGPQHVRDGRVRFTQAKNEHRKPVEVDVPLHPDLDAAIAAYYAAGHPRHMTFLVTAYGRPMTSTGFGNHFRAWCDEAGLPQCSAHGLRKALAARLAEGGASGHEIMAWTGHQTLEEVELYTRAARRRRMADSGLKKLGGGDGS